MQLLHAAALTIIKITTAIVMITLLSGTALAIARAGARFATVSVLSVALPSLIVSSTATRASYGIESRESLGPW